MRNLFPILFALIVLGIFISANIYMSRRFAWSFGTESTWPFYLLFAFLTVFMIGGMIAFSNSRHLLGSLVYCTAAIIMGLMLYLLLSVLLVHLIHQFVSFSPITFGLVAILLAVMISATGIWNSFRIRTTEKEILLKGLQKEVRAVHLSDIHIGHFRGKGFLQKIVDISIRQNPDVVFLTGDLFDGKIRMSAEYIAPLKQLEAPVYFVNGNHDGYSGVERAKQLLHDMNIRVLENETDTFGGLQIIGLNHMRSDPVRADIHSGAKGTSIKDTLAAMQISNGQPAILLHHSPDGIEHAAQNGIDLYLAGHTHGGQLFPVNYINDLLFKYNRGLHRFYGTKILVSQGIGTFGPPIRICTKSEIITINLKPSD